MYFVATIALKAHKYSQWRGQFGIQNLKKVKKHTHTHFLGLKKYNKKKLELLRFLWQRNGLQTDSRQHNNVTSKKHHCWQ